MASKSSGREYFGPHCLPEQWEAAFLEGLETPEQREDEPASVSQSSVAYHACLREV
jgi:hypothetical protein